MALSLTSLKMVAPPFSFDAGGGTIIAGPYRVAATDYYLAGSIRAQVFKAGARQSMVYVAGSQRSQVTR